MPSPAAVVRPGVAVLWLWIVTMLLLCRGGRLFQRLLRGLTACVVTIVVVAAIVIALGNLIQLLRGGFALGITRCDWLLLRQRFRRIRMTLLQLCHRRLTLAVAGSRRGRLLCGTETAADVGRMETLSR